MLREAQDLLWRLSAEQQNSVTQGRSPLASSNRYLIFGSSLAVAAGVLLTVFAGSDYLWPREVVSATDLTIGSDCKLESDARIIGSSSLTLPANCTAATISLYEIAQGAKLQVVADGKPSNSPPLPPSFQGANGSNGVDLATGQGRRWSRRVGCGGDNWIERYTHRNSGEAPERIPVCPFEWPERSVGGREVKGAVAVLARKAHQRRIMAPSIPVIATSGMASAAVVETEVMEAREESVEVAVQVAWLPF